MLTMQGACQGRRDPAPHLFSARCRGVNLHAADNVFPVSAGKILLAFSRPGSRHLYFG